MSFRNRIADRGAAFLDRLGVPSSAMSLLGPVAVDTTIYSIGPILAAASGVALVAILTRMFSPAEYGSLDTLLAFGGTIASSLLLGVDAAAGRYYFDREDGGYRRLLLSTGLLFLLSLGSLATAFLVFCSGSVSRLLLEMDGFELHLLALALGLPAATVDGFLRHVLRWQRSRRKYLLSYLAWIATRLVLTVLLSHYYGLVGAILGWSVSITASACLSYWLGRSSYRLTWSTPMLRDLLKFGTPLALTAFALPASYMIDRFFLIRFHSLGDAGIYGVALAFAGIYKLAAAGFQAAWGPIAFSSWKDPAFVSSFARLVELFLLGGASLAICLGLLGPAIVALFVPGEYAHSAQLLSPLVIGGVAQDLLSLLSIGLFFHKRTGLLFLASSLGLTVNVTLDEILVRPLGPWGASIANTCGWLTAAAMAAHFSQKLMHVPYDRRKITFGVVLAVFAMLLPWLRSVL